MNAMRDFLILIALLLATRIVWADEAPTTQVRDSIFVNIGGTTPLSPGSFVSNQNVGYNGGLGYGFGLSPLFQLVIDANSDNFPLNYGSASYNGLGINGGNMRVTTLLANLRFRLLSQDNPVVPYLIGGIGAARVAQAAITNGNTILAPATTTGNFAARLGIGIDIRLSSMASLYVETSDYAIAVNNGTGNIDFNSFRLGGKFNL